MHCRSYKNGFVWHDLSEDDLIFPVQGNEYVLKGSELLDQTPPGTLCIVSFSLDQVCSIIQQIYRCFLQFRPE